MSVITVRLPSAFRFIFTTALIALICACTAEENFTVEDKLLLQEALAQYPYRWDSKDSEGFANLFTEDGVLEQFRNGNLVPGSVIEGRQAILAYASQSHTGRLADRQTRHHFSSVVIVETYPARVVTENMALITHQISGGEPAFISSSGIYRIDWRKTPQGWKMQKRQLFVDSAPGQ